LNNFLVSACSLATAAITLSSLLAARLGRAASYDQVCCVPMVVLVDGVGGSGLQTRMRLLWCHTTQIQNAWSKCNVEI
jgi:hypothetical protein